MHFWEVLFVSIYWKSDIILFLNIYLFVLFLIDVTFPFIVIVVSVISSAIHFATEINQVLFIYQVCNIKTILIFNFYSLLSIWLWTLSVYRETYWLLLFIGLVMDLVLWPLLSLKIHRWTMLYYYLFHYLLFSI